MTQWLDRIDGSMQKIHSTINDIKAYQTQKIVQASTVPPAPHKHVTA